MNKLLIIILATVLSSCAHSGKNAEWSGWNKFWFASAVGGQAADVWSTQDALNRGCVEGNPLFGDNPSTGLMVGAKAAVLALQYVVIENLVEPESQESSRNWIYAADAFLGFGLAVHNYGVDCY